MNKPTNKSLDSLQITQVPVLLRSTLTESVRCILLLSSVHRRVSVAESHDQEISITKISLGSSFGIPGCCARGPMLLGLDCEARDAAIAQAQVLLRFQMFHKVLETTRSQRLPFPKEWEF